MTSEKIPVNVTSQSTAREWLEANIGCDVLSGYFIRDHDIVYTPREGHAGYIPPDGDDEDGPAQVRLVSPAHICATINSLCWPYRQLKTGEAKESSFPYAAGRDIIERPDLCPRLRRLHSVSHTPIMKSDGTVLMSPGYDASSGIYYLPHKELSVSVPSTPSSADVASALALLEEMVAGFKWAGSHDKINYFGLLLTPLIGSLAPPPYKMAVISAPQPGSGKSLLASIARTLHGGIFRSEMPEDEAELRKQVSAILDQTTAPIICVDNVTGVLRSSTLSGLLTSAQWDDRRLGSTEIISRANNRVWVITGNNVTLGGDLARRSLWITIDPKIPHPERRTNFAITDLKTWVHERRSALLSALLTLVRAWVVAGGPIPPARSSDDYNAWRRVVSGILVHAGVSGTFDDEEGARQDVGSDDDEWRDFLAAIHRSLGEKTWTAKQLLMMVNTGTLNDLARPLQIESLPGELADRIERAHGATTVVTKSLGRWLMNREGRWAGEFSIRAGGHDTKSKSRLWGVTTNPANIESNGYKSDTDGVWGYVGFSPNPRLSEIGHMFEEKVYIGAGSKPDKGSNPARDVSQEFMDI